VALKKVHMADVYYLSLDLRCKLKYLVIFMSKKANWQKKRMQL